MASFTLKGVPDELLDALRTAAERERRSLNQQAIYLLEQAVLRRRGSFLERLEALYQEEGAPDDADDPWEDVRDDDPGRDVDL